MSETMPIFCIFGRLQQQILYACAGQLMHVHHFGNKRREK